MNVAYLAMQTEKPPLDNVKVRRAIWMAIDKPRLIDIGYAGHAQPAVSMVPPAMWGHLTSSRTGRSIQRRRRSCSRRSGGGRGLHAAAPKLTLCVMNQSRPYLPQPLSIAGFIKDSLRPIGIEVTIEGRDVNQHFEHLMAGRHQLGLAGWNSDNSDPDNFLYSLLDPDNISQFGNNLSRWRNDRFHELCWPASAKWTQDQRLPIYLEAQALVLEEAPSSRWPTRTYAPPTTSGWWATTSIPRASCGCTAPTCSKRRERPRCPLRYAGALLRLSAAHVSIRLSIRASCPISNMPRFAFCLLLLFTTPIVAADSATDGELANWHQFRGPLATGVAPHGNPPLVWSETQNVRWKVSVPGVGSSTPIVWEDKIFLLTAIDTGNKDSSFPDPQNQPERPFGIVFPNTLHQFAVLCLDRKTGRTLWEKVATEVVPHEGHHPDNDFASSTPITDGQRLFVNFGSRGVYCYDLDGNLQWKRDFGQMQTRLSFGEGSSPALADGTLVTVWDHDGPSFIVAQDAKTGDIRWKQDRDEQSAWATPLIVEHGGHKQVVTNASNKVRSYDLQTGELLWECAGQVGNVAPSPVTNGELVFCMSGYRGSALFALPLDQRGDLSDSDKIAWKHNRGTPYIPSPLLYQGQLVFTQSNDNLLSTHDAATGEPLLATVRLPGIRNLYASPVAAAGRIYLTSRTGTTIVLRPGNKLDVLATNQLDGEQFDASPAIVGNEMFIRSRQHLYCLAEPSP
jgi:outer membrane protein assembly factor BamB